MRVRILKDLEVYNAAREGLDRRNPSVTEQDLGLRSMGADYAMLPTGTYELETVTISMQPGKTVHEQEWWLLRGSIWGAYAETWTEYANYDGYCELLESQGITLEEFLREYHGRNLHTDIGRRRRLELRLEGTRIVEFTIYYPESDPKNPTVLSDRTIDYLPLGTQVMNGYILLPTHPTEENQT